MAKRGGVRFNVKPRYASRVGLKRRYVSLDRQARRAFVDSPTPVQGPHQILTTSAPLEFRPGSLSPHYLITTSPLAPVKSE